MLHLQATSVPLPANLSPAADLLAQAQFPVPGLGFTEGGVTLNGLPLEQASGAEQAGAQVWLEVVGKGGVGIVIEDGQVEGAEPVAKEKEAVHG